MVKGDVTYVTLLGSSCHPNWYMSSLMSPNVEVEATDVYFNRDLDWTGTVSISSTGTMTGSPITEASINSVASFNNIIHTVAGSGLNLNAVSTGLIGANSNTFNINVFVFNSGDFRPDRYLSSSASDITPAESSVGNLKFTQSISNWVFESLQPSIACIVRAYGSRTAVPGSPPAQSAVRLKTTSERVRAHSFSTMYRI